MMSVLLLIWMKLDCLLILKDGEKPQILPLKVFQRSRLLRGKKLFIFQNNYVLVPQNNK